MPAVARLCRSTPRPWSIPPFLCLFLERVGLAAPISQRPSLLRSRTARQQYRPLHVQSAKEPGQYSSVRPTTVTGLPWTCPGCGAYTQTAHPDEAGFYSTTRKPVKAFLATQHEPTNLTHIEADKVFNQAVENADPGLLKTIGLDGALKPAEEVDKVSVAPICDRCHNILHHNKGVSIVHPTLQSIQDIISESPYKYNHIYHVIDAADFPLSAIPRLQQHLSLTPQRSRNRRAKTDKFYQGRQAEMSFIVTRADLLAPVKQQVDSLMPYLIQVLRDALGPAGQAVRLGNVRCVSSKRGWWTKQLKEDIWKRGGGGWMVGKVNVGKSSLFEVVFPKGRSEEVDFGALRKAAIPGSGNADAITSPEQQGLSEPNEPNAIEKEHSEDLINPKGNELSELSLLPPAPAEIAFPVMPIISHLSGTTASPIRLPFGGGKGELIDLPGLARGNLEDFVQEEHKSGLVMQHRVKAKQYSIKPGQSLLFGNLVRITSNSPDTVLLAHPFLTTDCHVTGTEKAADIQAQIHQTPVANTTKPGVGPRMKSAGNFELKWDVTKQRAGPLTAPSAAGLKPKVLPFVILSTDILIEGCGWIELVAQVRKRALEANHPDEETGSTSVPSVEVFSPDGKHVGARRPMGAWLLGGRQRKPVSQRTTRPRRSMKGVKKNLKKIARAAMAE